MIHEGHHLAFRLKPRDHFARAYTGFDEFDRHAAPDRLFLLSQPDLAHSAFAESSHEVVSPDDPIGSIRTIHAYCRRKPRVGGGRRVFREVLLRSHLAGFPF